MEFSLPLEEPGCVHLPWLNPRYTADLLQAILTFRWFPIHKPSSNCTVPVAWITEPATDGLPIITFTLLKFLATLSKVALFKGLQYFSKIIKLWGDFSPQKPIFHICGTSTKKLTIPSCRLGKAKQLIWAGLDCIGYLRAAQKTDNWRLQKFFKIN